MKYFTDQLVQSFNSCLLTVKYVSLLKNAPRNIVEPKDPCPDLLPDDRKVHIKLIKVPGTDKLCCGCPRNQRL